MGSFKMVVTEISVKVESLSVSYLEFNQTLFNPLGKNGKYLPFIHYILL